MRSGRPRKLSERTARMLVSSVGGNALLCNALEYSDYFFDVTSNLTRQVRNLSTQLFSYIFKKVIRYFLTNYFCAFCHKKRKSATNLHRYYFFGRQSRRHLATCSGCITARVHGSLASEMAEGTAFSSWKYAHYFEFVTGKKAGILRYHASCARVIRACQLRQTQLLI